MGQGLGLFGTITVVFIILKLLNVIAWSWWWVLSPIWVGIIIVLIALGIILILGKKIRKTSSRNFYKR